MRQVVIESTDLESKDRVETSSEVPHPGNILFCIVIIALTLRFIVVLFVFRGRHDPSGDYQAFGQEAGWIARSIALHRGFSSPFFPITGPTALLPPLYPYLLSVVFRIFGVYTAKSAFIILSLNSIFSALTCIPIYFATKISLNARFGMFAGWAWALYPFAIYFSAGRVWEYSLTSLLFTTCFWMALCLHRYTGPAPWLAFGLLYGVTALTNPSTLSLLPCLLLLAVWRVRRTGGPWLRNGILTILCTVAAVTPWSIRNYRTLHILCPVRDNFYEELWAGNTGDTSNPMPGWTHPASSNREMELFRSSGEAPYLAQKRLLVIGFVTHHPMFFTGLTLRRILYFWTGFWSLDHRYVQSEPFELSNVLFCTSLTLLMLLGARTWWRADRAMALPYLVVIAIFPLTYYISHPLMDYRQPIEPEIVVLIVVGLHALRARLKRPQAHQYEEPIAAD